MLKEKIARRIPSSLTRRPGFVRLLSGSRSGLTRRLALPIAVILACVLLPTVMSPAHAQAPSSCANPVACENQLPGTPQSVWDVGSNDPNIQGFADPFSVNVGGSINFKIQSIASYSIDIYRMGYYGGDGARLITSLTPNVSASESQPACNTNTVTGLVDCGDWSVSATWNVPTTAVSGVYFAHIYTANDTDENQIPFVVTNTASTANIVFMTSDETWQAYNDWGGYSLYTGDATGSPWCCSALDPGRATQVSYNRPFATRFDTPYGEDFFFSMEFPMIEFLEENGYDVTYVSEADVSAPGAASMLEQHKIFLNAGHSEYWDSGARANLTSARNAGVNIAFFTGNTMWWKTRWANSQYGNEPYRTLITYKESLDTVQDDPADPPTWTGAWRDPRFMASGDDSGQPENALTGQLWTVNCCSYADQVPSQYSQLAIWKNTAVAKLATGQTYTMPNETLGYEWDSDVDNGFRPPGEIDMSKTCEDVSQALLTVNEDIGPAEECNSLTLYKAASGALVFDAGTVQWAWGLNNNHDGDENGTDPAMQQATVNLLAMMGDVQPTTLMSGLVPGTEPAYTAPPTSTITSPSAGATFANGSTATITGTATDSGGGVVAGVEVSTNGGSTWHPVTTMSAASTSVTWSYTWSAAGSGSVTLMSRATDDDGNMETPGPGVSVTVNCPCSIFGNNYTPSTTSAADSSSYELGMKFQSSVPGWVAGVRFYKGAGNNGTHTGSLWTASGTLLATGTFTNETASGWQSMLFTNPVEISANTTYVVSYWDPDGDYGLDPELFAWPLSTPPLTAVQSNYITTGGGNGVYYPGGQGFPTLQSDGSSYAVDVIFDTTQPKGPPPSVTSSTPYSGSSSDPVSTDPAVTFSEPVTPSSTSFTLTGPNGSAVAGSASFNSTDTVDTFTPSALAAGTTYTATISGATDQFGQTMTTYTYTFTTSKAFDSAGQCPCAIWPDVAPSGATDANDTSAVNLGVQFQAAQNGTVSGIRFYKEPDNTGTHTGTLWTASGTELATGTFTNESTEGWEELDFSTPVTVTAGTTYVASYSTTTGHYADTSGGLSSAVTNGPLTALASGGVYAYGSAGTFPTSTYNSSNYWVDVVFQPNMSPPTVAATTPGNSATSVPVSTAVTVTFNEAIQSGSATFSLTGPGGSAITGSSSLVSGTVLTFTPSSALSPGTAYQASVSGATSTSGVAMTSPDTWSFTTSGSTACPCTIFESDATPATPSVNDSSSVEVGVKFQVTTSGWIYGVRFYKGSGNTGTHTGSLWTDTGILLAHGTFTNETSSGWQTLEFPTAVPVNPGQTYVASYYAPNGDYASTNSTFANSPYSNAPLVALQNGTDGGNGVYSYGGDQFPTSTYNSTNYWVDPIFYTSTPPNAPSCPCSIWSSSATPSVASVSDTSAVNVGVQFTPEESGYITGIRFYKGSANTGTHVGSLWTTSGTLLGQVTFTNETASGWQQANFSSPIAVTAGTTYVASYFAPNGGYADNSGYFASSGVFNSPLYVPPSSAVSSGNGVYGYGSSPGFPSSTYDESNYWVDVVFSPTS
jgi:methionine-rich copper-binding protein CopC